MKARILDLIRQTADWSTVGAKSLRKSFETEFQCTLKKVDRFASNLFWLCMQYCRLFLFV